LARRARSIKPDSSRDGKLSLRIEPRVVGALPEESPTARPRASPRARGAGVATTSRLGRCTCHALLISRSIDNARADEGQFVQNSPDAAIDLEGFSGESSLVFNR
jgi:hypothetical protein